MFNHCHTILLITRQVLARIDLRGRKRLSVKQIWTVPGCDYDDILLEVPKAVRLGVRPAGRVTIVSPDFWTGILNIPKDVVDIANDNEIKQALALEAEVDSGISAFESRTMAARLAQEERHDECHWCVTQVQLKFFQELSGTLRTLGTKLHSVAHPVAAQLFHANSVSVETVQGHIDSWREPVTFTDAELQQIATDWATCVAQTPAHPLLMLVERDSEAAHSQSVALKASVALLVAGGCGLGHWQTQKSLGTTTQAIEQLEKQQSQREAMEAALKNAEASVTQLGQEVLKTQAARLAAERQIQLAGAVHSLHNRRWLALVDALAASASETCWVQKLESNPTQTVVHGMAIDNAAASSFAAKLELALKGSGWRAAPAATSPSPHDLIEFKIVLQAAQKLDEASASSGIAFKRVLPDSSIDLARGLEP
jgi:hypothetical protein